ncbi:hypothetical protein [Leptolyngbya sp. FACHB-321]|nr:hypothetical protein [Leptolyngbya sp. FACHB-321]
MTASTYSALLIVYASRSMIHHLSGFGDGCRGDLLGSLIISIDLK